MATLVTWTPALSVGHNLLDAQHQKLFLLCDRIGALSDKSGADLSDAFHLALNELCIYAEEHFSTEEKLLDSFNFPFIEEMRKEHNEFITNLSEILYDATRGIVDSKKLYAFVTDWLESHVMKEDMKYKSYLVAQQ